MENAKCGLCGSLRCAQILYGRVVETQQLRQALAAGQVVLGGCIFSDNMPQWRCLDCGQEWRTSLDHEKNSP